MKKITKVLGIAVLIIALASCLAASYYLAGPAMKTRTDKADKALSHDRTARTAAERALDETAALPSKWQGLSFDETAELARINSDIEASRKYKVDDYRDPAAATVAKDISSTEKDLANAEKDLRGSYKELLIAHKTYLPANRSDAVDSALRENTAVSRNIRAARDELKELKSDNFIWGYLAVVVKSDGDVMAALFKADTALKSGDYIALQEAIATTRASLTYSTDWLTLGAKQLVNLVSYPKDAVPLVGFVSQGLKTTQSFEQGALFMFGERADSGSLKQSTEQATAQLAELQKTADTQQLGRGYKEWFLGIAKKRL